MPRITAITVKYGRTHNLGDYSNVRPEIILTAELNEGEDPDAALRQLEDRARVRVEALVDNALEASDEPPVFYRGRRYALYTRRFDKIVVLAPFEFDENKFEGWGKTLGGGRRLEVARLALREDDRFIGWRKYDCADGDLTALPQFGDFVKIYNAARIADATAYAAVIDGVSIPTGWSYHSGGRSGADRIRENFLSEAKKYAQEMGLAFYDATDGDLSKLPPAVADAPGSDYDEDEENAETDENYAPEIEIPF